MKKKCAIQRTCRNEFYFTFTFFLYFFIRFVAMFNNVFYFKAKSKSEIHLIIFVSNFDFARNSIKSDDTDYSIILMTDRKQNPRKF